MNKRILNSEKASIYMFLAVFIMYTTVFMTKQCFNAAMAGIVNEGVMTKTQTGFIIMVFYAIYAPMQIVGGIAADRFDNAKLIMLGLLGAALLNIIIYFARSYAVIVAAWGLNAAVQFALWPSVVLILTKELHPLHRQKAVVYITLSQQIGAIAAFWTAAYINKWQNNFLVSAIALSVVAVLFYLIYTYLKRHSVSAGENKKEAAFVKRNKVKMLKMNTILLGSGLIFVLFMAVIRDSIINWQRGLSPVMLMESYESVSPKIGNLMNIIIIVFGIAAVFMAETVNEHFRKKEFKILTVTWALTLPLYCILIFIGKVNIAFCVLALALGYFFITIGTATLNGWVIQFEPYKCEGMVAGMINCAAAVGTIIESYVFCVIADKSGWISVIYLCAFLSFMSVILMLCAARLWKRFVINNKESDKS